MGTVKRSHKKQTIKRSHQKRAIKPEHKKQLHERVLERCSQLNASLLELQTDDQSAKSERARAVEGALAALTTHLSGGWESIDEPESAALSRWLEASQFLFDAKPASVEKKLASDETCSQAHV